MSHNRAERDGSPQATGTAAAADAGKDTENTKVSEFEEAK